MRTPTLTVLAVAMAMAMAAMAVPSAARADAPDLFGVTARESATANASAPTSAGYVAAYQNPATAALVETTTLGIGYGAGIPRLRLNGQPADLLAPRGLDLGMVVPFRLGREMVLSVAVGLYIPDSLLARIHLVPATEPRFALLENYPDRIVVSAAVGLRPVRWMSIGVGVQFLADVAGDGITFDLGVSGKNRQSTAQLDISLPLRVTPLVGLWFLPHDRVRVGVDYRGAIDLRLQLAVKANLNIANVYTGDAHINLTGEDYYTPRRVSGGLAVDVLRDLTAYAQVVWWGWSGLPRTSADLTVQANLGLQIPLVSAVLGAPQLHDTVSPRMGLEWRRRLKSPGEATWAPAGLQLAVRGGYAFEPTPVPDQRAAASLVDNNRHVVATGAGLSYRPPGAVLSEPLSLDASFQWHHLQGRDLTKPDLGLPGARLRSSGELFHVAATLMVRF
jgi:long-chain fatty acid transport protein